jgi:hypothetical protein
MHSVTAVLHPCAHCDESGTCARGANSFSCAACVKTNELKGNQHVGLICGVCAGLGRAEAGTERLNKRVAPLLAMSIVIMLLAAIAAAAIADRHFNEVLAFGAGIIGTILGFYFSGKSSAR